MIVVPFVQQIVRMDLPTRVLDVPPQDVISKDNVSVRVNAVVYFRVMDAEKAVIQVEHCEMATSQFAQTTLRSVVGQHDFDEMLAEREKVNAEVQRILDARTYSWGIKVSNVERKQIDLNETMIRAIAKQTEAERLRRAKVIDAEGELQAAERLAQAGEMLAKRPEAMQLRYLGTLLNIAGEKNSTVVFSVPMDLPSSPDGRPAVTARPCVLDHAEHRPHRWPSALRPDSLCQRLRRAQALGAPAPRRRKGSMLVRAT